MNRSYRRTVLTACVLAYFGTRITQLVVSPLVPAITVAFDVSAGAIGFALTAMWAGYALVQLPSSLFGDRFGERPVILLALGLAVAASLALAGPDVPDLPDGDRGVGDGSRSLLRRGNRVTRP